MQKTAMKMLMHILGIRNSCCVFFFFLFLWAEAKNYDYSFANLNLVLNYSS